MGHRIRIDVSSSSFPRFDRNLNTGGNNYDEAAGVVARNRVHHSKQYPSSVTFTVARGTVWKLWRSPTWNRHAGASRETPNTWFAPAECVAEIRRLDI